MRHGPVDDSEYVADSANLTNFRFDTQGQAIDFAAGEGQDRVCKTCHGGFKNREVGVDK